MKSYLLGTLEKAEAAKLERKYFLDKGFFREVVNAEKSLIEEYLLGHLSASDTALFKRKYLQVPQLVKRVAEVRADLGLREDAIPKKDSTGMTFSRWLVFAAAAIILVIAGTVFERGLREPIRTALMAPKTLKPVTAMVLNLSPGLLKGAESHQAALFAAGNDTNLQLNLELPGRTGTAEYTVQLQAIQADDSRRNVWSGHNSQLSESAGGSIVSAVIPGALVTPGDYLVEVRSPQAGTLETYTFHVRSPI